MPNQYVFLPWLQRGLAKQIVEPDPLTAAAVADQRPTVSVKLKIMADDIARSTISQDISLLGAGDVVGISSQAIVKTDPANGTKNFEPNYFPYIEFYEEDFLWRYSPAKAAGDKRLRPWLCLIVLKEHEFERLPGNANTNNAMIRVLKDPVSSAFPPASQTWAWSHVQVNDGQLMQAELTDATSRNNRITSSLNSNPNLGVSRLVCPRKLQPDTGYHAFLIPAFERGRIAGTGGKKAEIEAVGRFEPSWGSTDISKNKFPLYYEWRFNTGREDFEALAKKIVPRDLSKSGIGKLWMDASNINYGKIFDYKGIFDPANATKPGFLPFEGALKLPESSTQPALNLTERTGINETSFVAQFAKLINLGVQYRQKTPAELQWSVAALGNENDDPMLVPPIYGSWYVKPDGGATVDPLLPGNWLEQLNLDPAMRVAAGLGAEVIKENQDEYVSRAWEQLSDNRKKLNIELQRLRFSQEVTKATYQKHFVQQSDTNGEGVSKVLAFTQSIHSQVSSDQSGLSISAKISGSLTDAAFVQPVYRRITRTNGPVMKRLNTTAATYSNVVMNSTTQFAYVSFMLIMIEPPFQNFSSRMLRQFDSNNFIWQGRSPNSATYLENPNWFGDAFGTYMFSIATIRTVVKDLVEKILPIPQLSVPPAIDLRTFSVKVMSKILPSNSFKAKYQAVIPMNTATTVTQSEIISPNSFNPFYTDPMFERLASLKPELFIPNLEKIEPDSFVLLQANSPFIEAFMVGLNHELGAEFLWRGFPSDLNATYFRQFWDTSDSPPSAVDKNDIKPIRSWTPNIKLGKHAPDGKMANPLVFVIKAELVRKYPNLVVYAMMATLGSDGQPVPDKTKSPLLPVFLSNLDPDYLFAGFELTKEQATGNLTVNPIPGVPSRRPGPVTAGYYFVIAERPGEMHFGLDQSRNGNTSWNDLAWTDFATNIEYIDLERDIPPAPVEKNGLEWGKGQQPLTADPAGGTGDAAQMAAILQQRPVQICIHASVLIK